MKLNLRRIFVIFVRAKMFCTTVFYSGAVMALPVDHLGCPKASNPFMDLINYVGEDKREYLDVGGPKLGLTADEMDRIRKTTGLLSCPLPGGGVHLASASLVGNGTQIITAAHAFQNILTGKFYEPLSSCTFSNFEKPPVVSKLAITSNHQNLLIGYGYPKNPRNDYAFAKLSSPITSAKPFPVDLSDTSIPNHSSTIVVSAEQTKMKHDDPSQPIVEPCGMEDQNFFGASTLYFNDCTLMPGASGGAQLKRAADGQLVLKGLVVQEGTKNHENYNRNDGSYGMTIAIGTRILSDLKKFDPSISLGSGGVEDNH